MAGPNNLSLFEIKIAQWLGSNKPLFKRLLITVLITINVIILAFVFYQIGLYIIYQKSYERTINQLTKNLVDYISYNAQQKANPLLISNLTPIYLGPDYLDPTKLRYDLIAEIENPNTNWAARSLDAQFVFDSQAVKVQISLLPGEKKYLAALNQLVSGKIQTFDAAIQGVGWQRIRPEMKEKLTILNDLKFQEVNFIPQSIVNQKVVPARIQFRAVNQSAYSFYSVNAQIAVYQGVKIVGIYILPIKNWRAGETQSLEINLSKSIEFASQVKIVPDVDLLNEAVFIKL